MKTCAYCGAQNDDAATHCAGCGTENSGPTASEVKPAAPNRATESSPAHPWLEPSRLFRGLILIGTVSYLLWFFEAILRAGAMWQAEHDALAWRGYAAIVKLPPIWGWLFTLLFFALAVGMYSFSKLARLTFTLLIAFWTLWSLVGGIEMQTAWGSFLISITRMADGATLALAYTVLKERFR